MTRIMHWIIEKLVRALLERIDCGDEFYFEIFQGEDKRWYIRIVDNAGDTHLWSGGYRFKSTAITIAAKIMMNPPTDIRVLDAFLDKRKE